MEFFLIFLAILMTQTLLEQAKNLIREGWPHRHNHHGQRTTLRSLIRTAKEIRNAERKSDEITWKERR
jgi:hypothetical protein